METRRELIAAVADRYRKADRTEKKLILDEFAETAGYHRKYAIRMLRGRQGGIAEPRGRRRIYNEAVVTALTIIWEAADRICGKRLKAILPTFVESMERHRHLCLEAEVRSRLLGMSAATIDRLLRPIRDVAKQRRRRTALTTPLRKSIAVRTFNDWKNPSAGYFEMDMVAHCGNSLAGSHVHSLVLTDISSGWTEAAALIVREQTLITVTLDEIQARLPFPMLGLDVDNDGAFINETMVSYCRKHELELTRSRPYKKNDQAWVEQKNGAIIRKLVGYGRLEGADATVALAELHNVARLYINFFQPSFKLKSKEREGSKVTKKYHAPATPCDQLLADERVTRSVKENLRQLFATLDPVQLLKQIRDAQRKLVDLEPEKCSEKPAKQHIELTQFAQSLTMAWRHGEVRPTHRKRRLDVKPRTWRTRIDPFADVWPLVQKWLNEEPNATAKDLFLRLHAQMPGSFKPNQLRTLQRRVKEWRTAIARQLILGCNYDCDAQSIASGMSLEKVNVELANG
jgi:hypothetical protein